MAITQFARLYSADASETVRQGLAAADAGTWTPDDISDEDDRRAVILDAREWETIRVYPEFVDGAGDVAVGTSIEVIPLVQVRDERGAAVRGRRWLALASTGAIADGASVEVPVAGHFAAFRIAAVTLGGANAGAVKVTGGKRRDQNHD